MAKEISLKNKKNSVCCKGTPVVSRLSWLRVVGLFLFAVVLTAAACKTTNPYHPAAIRQTEEGIALMEQGRYGSAEQRFQNAIGIDPAYALAYDRLGLIMLRRGLLRTAEKYFRKAVKRDANLTIAWTHLGSALRAQKLYKEASLAFQRAIDTQPDAMTPRLLLAQTYRTMGQYQLGRVQCLRMIADHPQKAPPHFEMGLIYLAEEQDEQALLSFQRALKRDAGHTEALRMSARVLQTRKRFSQSLQHIDLLLQRIPNDPEALRMRGELIQALRTGATPASPVP